MAKIIMRFKPGQPIETRVEGAVGSSCRTLTKTFEDLIGGKQVSTQDTQGAHYEPTKAVIEQKAGL